MDLTAFPTTVRTVGTIRRRREYTSRIRMRQDPKINSTNEFRDAELTRMSANKINRSVILQDKLVTSLNRRIFRRE